jgi:hypothetical protein
MTTLKLKKDKPPAPRSRSEPRGPVRGVAAPRKQRTLAEAQAERAARAAQQRRPTPEEALRDSPATRREPPRETAPGNAP